MNENSLSGRYILIVKDEYLLADDLRAAMHRAGAEVLGPFPTLADAAACIDTGSALDAAVLDVNLQGEMVFSLADMLVARGVPFIFSTGYDQSALPARFASAPRLEKPIKMQAVATLLMPLFDAA
ncbi:response regulator [Sphingomonas jatrophae]|uniref:CheY chemotaxis protein or a CheY-like REC (Receiver) domain n=1 Tax=Sphingomonas jatrophae TaxID=1166337 RepID=A0A1I6KZ07_9SPHN|nr:response regulator [Sphingomonas jatrophae]SFR96459.1 CheY chemotaxis protein or a CheY-like REC (receiver) domain [Sphingomonas jatrophae]